MSKRTASPRGYQEIIAFAHRALAATNLVRESLISARSRLKNFFCAIPRRCIRLERAEKVSGDRCYFANGGEECGFVGFRWLVETADLSHELQ
jgi:hypothetical protein